MECSELASIILQLVTFFALIEVLLYARKHLTAMWTSTLCTNLGGSFRGGLLGDIEIQQLQCLLAGSCSGAGYSLQAVTVQGTFQLQNESGSRLFEY